MVYSVSVGSIIYRLLSTILGDLDGHSNESNSSSSEEQEDEDSEEDGK